MRTDTDVIVSDSGSVVGFLPVSEAGSEWMTVHLPDDAPRLGLMVFAECRYAGDIMEGMELDGLVLE